MTSSPKSEAIRISRVLQEVLGLDRFPVNVRELVLEWSLQTCPDQPIKDIKSVPLPSFEGMLVQSPNGDGWVIGVNEDVESEGRIRFTIAHEFGHYMLHRERQERFTCSNQDMHYWDSHGRAMEVEADTFASYLLMPLDDFRAQVDGQRFSMDLLRHCADRYGVSVTAAALKWREVAPGRVIVLSVKDGFLDWSCSNERAFRSGAYFATRKETIELPAESILNHAARSADGQSGVVPASVWLPRENTELEIEEHAFVIEGDEYNYTLGVLILPEVERYLMDEDELLSPLTGVPSFR
ncbi:ImmA/IrrE family metallo-endopeptidase [Pseudomonas aeruginosa]|uniref:ImmA/IrrE family metallo-endopeptidase n=1 Tax=Pseudomonas aeruginosa TaxID=287 RepID=UPI0009A42ECC|nr:ImmA/IrrE family metallo-endopeptidase [Pseudomonas aeruginosa]